MRTALRLPRGAPWLVLLAVAACQGPPEPPPPAPEAAPQTTVDLAPPAGAPVPAPPAPELCPALAGVLAAEPDGFARLRATRIADGRWLGRETLPGMERCTIEGEVWPRARYACASDRYRADNLDGAGAKFAALSDEIDQCLSKPIWFPRDWQKGEPFEFAMGERLQTWTDQSTSPPSQVVLKVQQDIDDGGYLLKLNLEAIR